MKNWHDPILSQQQAEALLAQPGHVLLRHQGSHLLARVVGAAPADIITLFTPEKNRRQGHARLLMEQLVALVATRECPAITLEVRASNNAAINLYESFGFTRKAMRKGYYANPPEDALVLTLSVTGPA